MIIPRPTELIEHPGRFLLGPGVGLTAGPGAEQAADLLAGYLGPHGTHTAPGPRIRLDLIPGRHPGRQDDPLEAQGYTLRIRPEEVVLTAPGEAGLLNGVQTLRQLLPAATLDPASAPPDAWWWPSVDIHDRPLLPWRGFLLDVARHFMPLDFLFRVVDQLALHKINVLHLHLTDDQGWRIEIEGLPRLTEIGAWRTESALGPGPDAPTDKTPHGGYYTAGELRALVAFAARRGITVVPEIDMPGHARAVLAAYPHLGNHPDRTQPVWTHWGVSEDILAVHDEALEFCRHVLARTIEIFPSRHIHIGGEECPTTQWHTSPAARERARELGLPSPTALHGWFLQQMRDFLRGQGRRAVCWDETGHASDPPADIVLSAWRESDHGAEAVRRGHQVIMSPHRFTYLDYPQSTRTDEPLGQAGEVVTLRDVYSFDPLAGGLPVADPALGEPGVLGAQAQLWTEFAADPEQVYYLMYPRLCALAETAWSTAPRDFDGFLVRLAGHRERLASLGAGAPHADLHTAASPLGQ